MKDTLKTFLLAAAIGALLLLTPKSQGVIIDLGADDTVGTAFWSANSGANVDALQSVLGLSSTSDVAFANMTLSGGAYVDSTSVLSAGAMDTRYQSNSSVLTSISDNLVFTTGGAAASALSITASDNGPVESSAASGEVYIGGELRVIVASSEGAVDLYGDTHVSLATTGGLWTFDSSGISGPGGGLTNVDAATLDGLDSLDFATSAQGGTADAAQPGDPTLTAFASQTITADTLVYGAGADSFATTTITAAARDLLDDVSASAQRATLGLVIGEDVLSPEGMAASLLLPGVNSAGSGYAIKFPSSAIGRKNFFGQIVFSLPDTTATTLLLTNAAVNEGIKVWWMGGVLRLEIGNGSDYTTWQYDATESISLSDNTVASIAWALDRGGNLNFAINGVKVGASIDVSGSVDHSIPAAPWYVLSDGATDYAGTVYERITIGLANKGESFAEQLSENVTVAWPGLLRFYELYASDFTGGADGFANVLSTAITSNETIAAESGWLKITQTSSGSTQFKVDFAGGEIAPIGSDIEMILHAYFPAANTEVDDLQYRAQNTATVIGSIRSDSGGLAADTIHILHGKLENISMAMNRVLFFMFATGDSSPDSSADVVYIKDVELYVDGVAVAIDLTNPGVSKPDLSGNQNHGWTSPDGIRYNDNRIGDHVVYGQLEWSAESTTTALFATGIEPLEAGDTISIWAKSSSGEDFVIGDEADGDRYFSEATISTAWTELTLANASPDGANFEITAQPYDGSASSESRTDTLDLRISVTRIPKL